MCSSKAVEGSLGGGYADFGGETCLAGALPLLLVGKGAVEEQGQTPVGDLDGGGQRAVGTSGAGRLCPASRHVAGL